MTLPTARRVSYFTYAPAGSGDFTSFPRGKASTRSASLHKTLGQEAPGGGFKVKILAPKHTNPVQVSQALHPCRELSTIRTRMPNYRRGTPSPQGFRLPTSHLQRRRKATTSQKRAIVKTGNGDLSITCSDRHCPKCQSLARAQWIHDRQSELLDVAYFHVVLTVPQRIAQIALQNKRIVYDTLFRATADTLLATAADPKHLGAQIGFFAVLHTWGQTLLAHPHLHCVIPGGGLSADSTRWISCRPAFFLPVKVLSRLFRRLFLKYLEKAFDSGQLEFFGSLETLRNPAQFRSYLAPLKRIKWVVYAKAPFAGPRQVLDYVGRYTHRVAISNNRILDIEDGRVTFHWKDYRDNDRQKQMILPADEFIRRFLIHVLPDGFQRIRYYGFLSNRHREEKLALCRQLLGTPAVDPETAPGHLPSDYDFDELYEKLTGSSLRQCPICRQGRMIVVEVLAPDVPEHIDTS